MTNPKIEIAPEEYWQDRLNWLDAKLYCFSLNIDGKTGWRLPDILDFHSPDFKHGDYWFWTCVTDDDGAIQVDGRSLYQCPMDLDSTAYTMTMPVRDLKNNS